MKQAMAAMALFSAGAALAAQAPFVQISGAPRNLANTCAAGNAAPFIPVNVDIPPGTSYSYEISFPGVGGGAFMDEDPSYEFYGIPLFHLPPQNGPVVNSNVAFPLPGVPAWYATVSHVAEHTPLTLVIRTFAGTNGNGALAGIAEVNWDCTSGDAFAPYNDGTALGAPPASLAKNIAVEFYHASLDHYFISAAAAEIADLDSGRTAGWTRTGGSFGVFSGSATATSPVCRFYIPPGIGNSHFYSASANECAAVLASHPNYTHESPAVFHVILPDATTGACPVLSNPVYRLWNQRTDSNHRYTTDPLIKAQMIARGYVAEGYGPDAVIMCAPA